ncbi:uncharacterized protein LOC111679191 isoform X2 [Lucilia cuprina]|uniref:uncharacterized protein LOC111679191 isoform X2 n=1 Tax=Lucilia cuprina TaxID=7375 RepID=UPI001F070A65|nr:uncharacterized protein LOC111679191 isoform X2 [Lucilia cuprina]
MDPKKITELATLLRNNGDKILSSEFTLTLSASLLRALNDSFTLIADSLEIGDIQNFQVVKPINSKSPVFRDLQLVHDFVQKTTLLCIIQYPGEECFEGKIDITKFRALKRLEIQKVQVKQICGLQPLRAQMQHLICNKSIKCVDEIITHCGGDNSNGFVWNELKIADFSYNNLRTVDTSLEFAQYLQHLNLRHNQLQSVKAIKWLPHLKTLDLSFNRLQFIPQFHMDAYKRLQSLNMSNNLLEDLMGIVKLDALTDLDLSDNCLLDHTYLLPLSAISTLKFLNLYGNPLQCHPKHRLASSQYLHKNCSSVKFILDFEPLTKNEKAVTGTHQIRLVGALNHYTTRSSTSSLAAVGRITPVSNQTPASSVGSLVSFKLNDNNSDTSETNNTDEVVVKPIKKKSAKVRHVEIEDNIHETEEYSDRLNAKDNVMNSSVLVEEENKEHLDIKGQVENLRKKYGNEWLHTGNAEIRNSVLGLTPSNTSAVDINLERQKSRQMFDEYVKDLKEEVNTTVRTSTPTNNTLDNTMAQLMLTPIKAQQDNNETTSLYQSLEQTQATLINNNTTDNDKTIYKSLDNTTMISKNPFEDDDNDKENDLAIESPQIETVKDEEEDHDILSKIYATNEQHNEEDEYSEREEDEETYIVYTTNQNEALFLTKSSNFLRERDPLTEKTKTKWSLKILESCDRIKSNTLRINFDTVKKDKQERVYTVEEDLCQELEKKLRDILSQRDLTEMNQTIYRCVNCSCQFSQETKSKLKNSEIRCPDCKSCFVAEIHEIPKSLEKTNLVDKLSPASIVEELPTSIAPLSIQQPLTSLSNSIEVAEETNSIGSANSLNESSCSKITATSHSESSFNSNQSLVGSSNTDRDLDFKTNGESDVDIISNPSQSSIEVLDPCASRKNWEERRSIAHVPNLETIDDQSYTQTFLEREFDNMINYAQKDKDKLEIYNEMEQQDTVSGAQEKVESQIPPKKSSNNMVHNNLTESSSSGSVTDSICTAYEQKPEKSSQSSEDKKECVKEFLQQETNGKSSSQNAAKKDENTGLSSIFGALMQSTNILMTSSKKLIDSETLSNVKSGTALPTNSSNNSSSNTNKSTSGTQTYKFNYTDFNDIDHRLKLYFYQTKFEKDEHFKWIVRGRIYNETNKKLSDGIVVMSTCKLYVMEAYAKENDDVAKWLKTTISCTVDRLDAIQLLPWKMGLSFYLNDWGGFLLLLQDILRTDSLMLFFANNALPSLCELKYQPADLLTKRLSAAVIDEQLNMCSLLNGCEISCENAKRSFNICGLLTTDSRIYLSSEKLDWLSVLNHDSDIELCVTQFMSNLVEVEHCADNVFIINFLDETQDKCELWKCTFQTAENANTCLNSIAQSWEKLFGVPLINA